MQYVCSTCVVKEENVIKYTVRTGEKENIKNNFVIMGSTKYNSV